MKTPLEKMITHCHRIDKENQAIKRKHRNYFIMFCIGFACATSMLSINMAIINYLIFVLPLAILGITYLIAIKIDTYR